MVINHLLNGMILQEVVVPQETQQVLGENPSGIHHQLDALRQLPNEGR